MIVQSLPGQIANVHEPRPFAGSRARPDRQVSGIADTDGHLLWLLDYTLGEPCGPSYVRAASQSRGYWASQAHAGKVAVYNPLLDPSIHRLLIIAVELHGEVHPSFVRQLRLWARIAARHEIPTAPRTLEEVTRLQRTAAHLLQSWRVVLSVALLRARVADVRFCALTVARETGEAAAGGGMPGIRGAGELLMLTRRESARSRFLGRGWRVHSEDAAAVGGG